MDRERRRRERRRERRRRERKREKRGSVQHAVLTYYKKINISH